MTSRGLTYCGTSSEKSVPDLEINVSVSGWKLMRTLWVAPRQI